MRTILILTALLLAACGPAIMSSTPRGHYCASSPTAGLCARERADCETAADAASGADTDLGPCTLVEIFWNSCGDGK